MLVHDRRASDWTEEQVTNFWDWFGSDPQRLDICFGNQVGKGIVNFAKATSQLHGRVLDFGCGAGHLLGMLLTENLECYGLDTSPRFIDQVNRKYQHLANWRGAKLLDGLPSVLPARYFDVVFCAEVLEHVVPAVSATILAEIRRILKPDGIAIVTTPYAEVLEDNLVYCPFCNSAYHRMQHFRSMTIESLTGELDSAGYRIVFCGNLDFALFERVVRLPHLRDWSYSSLIRWAYHRRRELLDRIAPQPFPKGRVFRNTVSVSSGRHLCAVARLKS